jgi:hypothetical protein
MRKAAFGQLVVANLSQPAPGETMKTVLTAHEHKAVEQRMAAVREEMKTLEEGYLPRAAHAKEWERLLDELADLQEKLGEE